MGVYSKDAVGKAMRFVGVVVESLERTFDDGGVVWQQSLFNRNTGKFIRAFSANVVDPTENPAAYARSGQRRILAAWNGCGVDADEARGFEGYEMEFDTIVRDYEARGDFKGGTSVQILPVKKVTKVSAAELARLKDQLEAEREKTRAQRPQREETPAAPTYAEAETEALLTLYHGRTYEQAQAQAAKAGLSTALQNDVATGRAAEALLGMGLLDMDDQDRFVKAG